MKSIYQLTALIGNKSDGINDEKFMTAAWILYAWMRREVIDCIPLPELPATVSKSAKTGRSVASIYQPEEHFFTLRSSVFENGIRDTVEAEIMPYRQSLLLAVRETAFLREPGAKAKPASGPLAFVRQLIDEVGLNDGRSFRQAFSVLPHNRLASWPTFCVPQTDGCQLLWSPRPKIQRLGKMDIWLTFASWPQIWLAAPM